MQAAKRRPHYDSCSDLESCCSSDDDTTSSHPAAIDSSDESEDHDRMESDYGDTPRSGATGAPVGVRKARNRELLGDYQPGCADCTTLRKWLGYRDIDWMEYRNDFCTYMCMGECALTWHMTRLYQKPCEYVSVVHAQFALPDDNKIAGLHRFGDALQEQHQWLYQELLRLYPRGMQTVREDKGAIGWSSASHVWMLLLKIQLLQAFVRSLAQLIQDQQRLPRSKRMMPAILPTHCAAVDMGNYHVLLEQFCPADLAATLRLLTPRMVDMGLVLMPDLQLGHYTQLQLWLQLYLLSTRWYEMDVTEPQLLRLLEALQLRLAEVCCLTWLRNNVHPSQLTASTPLDMPERYWVRTGTPERAEVRLDLDTQPGSSAAAVAEQQRRTKRTTPEFQVSKYYVGEMLGMLMGMHYSVSQVPQVREEEQAAHEELRQLFLGRLCAERRVDPVTYDELLQSLRDRVAAERTLITEPGIVEELCTDMRRLTMPHGSAERYAYMPRNAFAMTTDREQLENDCIPRPVLSARHILWCRMPLERLQNSPSIARASRNYFVMAVMRTVSFASRNKSDWLVEYVLLEHQLVKGPQVEEQRQRQQREKTGRLGGGTGASNRSPVLVTELDLRKHLDPSPFILQIGSQCFVYHGNQWIVTRDVYDACLLWTLCMVMDHRCRYDVLGQQVTCEHWGTFLGELLDTAAKRRRTTMEQAPEQDQRAIASIVDFLGDTGATDEEAGALLARQQQMADLWDDDSNDAGAWISHGTTAQWAQSEEQNLLDKMYNE